MVGRNRARYLAPLALTLTVAAAYVVVHRALTPKPKTTQHSVRHRHGRSTKAKFYTVKAGDTLSTISVKTGITVPTLEQLNPSVNPNALQTGQRLRLRR